MLQKSCAWINAITAQTLLWPEGWRFPRLGLLQHGKYAQGLLLFIKRELGKKYCRLIKSMPWPLKPSLPPTLECDVLPRAGSRGN